MISKLNRKERINKMKVVQKDDASGKEYEVIGIVILVGGSGFLYILLDIL